MPRAREVEVKSRFIYDRVRRRTTGEDEGTLRRSGRNRYTLGVEMEVGIVPGLSAMLGAEYRLGDADDAKSGRVRRQVELPAHPGLAAGTRSERRPVPALWLPEPSVALLASMPLGDVAEAPYIRANFI